MKRAALILSTVLSTSASLALADSHGMEGMGHEGMGPLMQPMEDMMAMMPMESTGLPDADFLLMMIPHHQSAIEMAQIELDTGKDEATRAMAQEIIDAQEAEIAEMRSMLEGMGVEPPSAD